MLFGKERILSISQLKRLGEHEYSSTSNSFLDPLMQHWWNWLVKQIPLWIAPNLITVLGLLVSVLTSLVLIFLSPDAKQEVPRWACFLCALGLFIYQSMDAIDGKQARRTGTSTPLGELFDHGCDSISTIFAALGACISCQLGNYPGWLFVECFSGVVLFYCAHWQAYVSGTLRFGRFDVTEAQFGLMGVHLISAIFGPSIWSAPIPIVNVPMYYCIFVITVVPAAVALSQYLRIIITGGAGKNGSSVAGTSVLSPIIPFGLVILPAFIIYRKSVEHVYEDNPALYIVAFGLVAAKVTNRLVVAHMTKSEMEYFDSSLLGPAMLFLNQYFNFFIKEYYVLWLCLIWAAFDLYRYCSQVCLEICDYLKIYLFKIVPNIPIDSPYSEKNGMNVRLTRSKASRAH